MADDGEEIAGLIIEPIQGEGGDNHFRNEFFTALREICNVHDILFIMDEVQTGVGLTGKFWAHQHFDAGPTSSVLEKRPRSAGSWHQQRVDEVENNVFRQASRLNSTFGGNLVDMVRFSHILRIIDQESLVENARIRGEELRLGLEALCLEFPQAVSNARGRGLMCAFDLPDAARRDQFRRDLLAARLLVVGCGPRSIRFRPHLTISASEVQTAIRIIKRVLQKWRRPEG